MSRKFFILVMSVTLVQTSVIAREMTYYNLSAQDSSDFGQIVGYWEPTNTARTTSFAMMLDYLVTLAYNIANGTNNPTGETALMMPVALTYWGVSAGLAFTALNIAVQQICVNLQAPIAMATYSTEIYGYYGDALTIAKYGIDSSQTETQIQNDRLGAHNKGASMVYTLYDLIRKCMKQNDTSVATMIDTPQRDNLQYFNQAGDGIFNLSTICLKQRYALTKDPTLTSTAKIIRYIVMKSVKSLAAGEFGLFLTSYLVSHVPYSGIAPQIYAIVISWLTSYDSCFWAIGAVYDVIVEFYDKIGSGNCDTASVNAARTNTSTNLQEAFNILIQSVNATNSSAGTVSAAYEQYFVDYANNVTEACYDAIIAAAGCNNLTYSTGLGIVETLKQKLLDQTANVISKIGEFISGGQIFNATVQAKLNDSQDAQRTSLNNTINLIWDSIGRLLNATFVSKTNTAPVDNSRPMAFDELKNLTYHISDCHWAVYTANLTQ